MVKVKKECKSKYSENDEKISDFVNKNTVEEDDRIELIGLGRKTYWKFPEHINNCPAFGCGLTFPARSGAITHYKEKHVTNFILCSMCVKPISARGYQKHMENVHPDGKVQMKIGKKTLRTIKTEKVI